MKIAHWVMLNGSGMHHMAEAMAEGERRLGHESHLIDVGRPGDWTSGLALEADVHVNHTRFPIEQSKRITAHTGKAPKVVFVSHGIPEHVIELAAQHHVPERFHASSDDVWAMFRHCLRSSDAIVVFTPRYQALFQTMVSPLQPIDLIPMGVDRAFWAAGVAPTDQLKGEPVVWTCENQHRIKWALDLFLAWPFVLRERHLAHLHAHFIPLDMHRILVDLANTNGAAMGATISSCRFSHQQLRDIWQTCDFNMATTRYGDNTLLTMQAEAAGLPTISYPGNEYASFWIAEGDQRTMAEELIKIFDGETPMRAKREVPDLADTARAMETVYARVLSQRSA